MRLRLPARSTLTWTIDRDEVIVREMLQGRTGAVAAIIFALFTLGVLALDIVTPDGFRKMGPYGLITPIVLAVSELTLIPMVVHQTWRQTLLTLRYNEMLLAFTSPLYRKHYRWTGDDIADILIIETANTETHVPLAELLITRCAGGDIHLFTDHHATEIKALLATLPPMLRQGQAVQPQAAAVMATPVVSTDPSIAASETSTRLIDVHREMRKRPT